MKEKSNTVAHEANEAALPALAACISSKAEGNLPRLRHWCSGKIKSDIMKIHRLHNWVHASKWTGVCLTDSPPRFLSSHSQGLNLIWHLVQLYFKGGIKLMFFLFQKIKKERNTTTQRM